MSKKYENFQEFLKEFKEFKEANYIDDVVIDEAKETITAITSKQPGHSVHGPTYEIEMTFYFSSMTAYAMAEMVDEGDGDCDEYCDEQPFYGGDCGETEIEDAEDLAGAFEDTDWIEL